MKINIDQTIPENMKDERCFFKCDEPKGSTIAGVLVMFLGIIFVPLMLKMLDGTVPVTLDGFLNGVFAELARVFGYIISPSTSELVFYAAFSMIAGILTIKAFKAVAVPIVFIGICMLAFFFLALFYLGIPIDYGLFFGNFVNFLLVFGVSMMLPCLAGMLISYVIISKKKCFVMGKGTTIKQ